MKNLFYIQEWNLFSSFKFQFRQETVVACRNYFPVAAKPSTSLLSSVLEARKRLVGYQGTRKSSN